MDRPLTHVHIEGSLPQLCPDVSVEAGFLAEFAGRGCAMRLALFQRATRCRPVRRRSSRTLIAVANEKDRAIRIEKHESRHFSEGDRKSTRLNSSHRCISYAVFCLK